ncbi:Mrr restriction endonuclease, partial [gut metagenome]
KDGGVRWLSYMHFYSIDFVKAGFIVKNKGRWFLTDEGKTALSKYNADELCAVASKAYSEWSKKQEEATGAKVSDCSNDDVNISCFADIKAQADDDLMNYIQSRTPYEFQDLVAALFRAMGYYTPFIAPKGKDGGIDIIAYSDPLGATKPILKVQVKHYNLNNPVSVDVIRSIVGVAKDDVAIVVTSGRFAEPARQEARQFNVRLIDG